MWYRDMADGLPQLVGIHDDDDIDPRMEARGAAVLERNRFSWIWVVPTCPYCDQEHHHYGGPLDGDPYRYTGHRVPAHCTFTAYTDPQHHTTLAARAYRLVPAPIRIQRRLLERQFRTEEHACASIIHREY